MALSREIAMSDGKYVHGHHASVLRSHSWRTVENSCPHLIPHLKPDAKILDVGCGPGTITCDLAGRVPQGSVLGIDPSADVIEKAKKYAVEHSNSNVTFNVGDIYNLDLPSGSFDIVHAHQVLQHISDPLGAMREMKRLAKPGGLLACRDVDYSATIWYPNVPGMDEWLELYQRVAKGAGGDPNIGRRLHAVALEAGFARSAIATTVSTWTFSTPEEREFWCGLWADRILNSDFKKHAIEGGHANEADLEKIAESWKTLMSKEDGWITLINCEIICRV